MATAFILEDDAFQAAYLQRTITQLGYEVLGPCTSVAEAHTLLDHTEPDFAVLDYAIRDETSRPIQKRLVERQVPFAVLTAKLDAVIVDGDQVHTMVIPKPCDSVGLELAVYELDRLRQGQPRDFTRNM